MVVIQVNSVSSIEAKPSFWKNAEATNDAGKKMKRKKKKQKLLGPKYIQCTYMDCVGEGSKARSTS